MFFLSRSRRFVDDGQGGVQSLGECRGAFHAAGIRRNDRQILQFLLLEVFDEDGSGEEVIDRHVEVALELAGVQVKGQYPVDACGSNQVGHQLGGDGHPGPVFAVLPSVAEIGDDGRDARRRGPPAGIRHDQQFHEVMVRGLARRLHQKNVLPADILLDLHEDFAVAEVGHLNATGLGLQIITNPTGQPRIGAPREKPQVFQLFSP